MSPDNIERGAANEILPQPWQSETCIGTWHYDKGVGDRNGYKKPAEIIPTLADIVSKNGNFLLSIPVRSDGTIDSNEVTFLDQLGPWMAMNGEAIYATRPWKTYGEGPAYEAASVPLANGEVAEQKNRPLGAEDIRFTTSKDGKTLYAIVCGVPSRPVVIRALPSGIKIGIVQLIGSAGAVQAEQKEEGLVIQPASSWPCAYAVAYRIALR